MPEQEDVEELRRATKRFDHFRWAELGITIVASVLSAAVTMTWIMSSALAELRAGEAEDARRITAVEPLASAASAEVKVLSTREDNHDRARTEDQARLARIEQKLDLLIDRRQ